MCQYLSNESNESTNMSDSNATSTNGESTVTQNTDASHPTSDTPVCIDNPFKPVQTPFTMKTKPDGPEVERTITDYAKVLHDAGIVKQPNYLVFTIDHFLSKDECQELIDKTEQVGYEQALVNIGFGNQKLIPDYRKSDRCIIDDFGMADWFWDRLKDFLEPKFKEKKVIGLNERMRFLRYHKGDFFKAHFDGSFDREEQKSQVTFFLYLNDDYQGGACNFLDPGARWNDKNDKALVPCPPQAGRLLVFQHNICHEGGILDGGTKYALRTDVMYER